MSVEKKEISKEKAFYFFTVIGNYIGEIATSFSTQNSKSFPEGEEENE